MNILTNSGETAYAYKGIFKKHYCFGYASLIKCIFFNLHINIILVYLISAFPPYLIFHIFFVILLFFYFHRKEKSKLNFNLINNFNF